MAESSDPKETKQLTSGEEDSGKGFLEKSKKARLRLTNRAKEEARNIRIRRILSSGSRSFAFLTIVPTREIVRSQFFQTSSCIFIRQKSIAMRCVIRSLGAWAG